MRDPRCTFWDESCAPNSSPRGYRCLCGHCLQRERETGGRSGSVSALALMPVSHRLVRVAGEPSGVASWTAVRCCIMAIASAVIIRLADVERPSQVAAQRPAEPGHVLDRDRPVEAELAAHLVGDPGIVVGAHPRGDRVARTDLHEHEDENRDAKEDGHREEQSSDDKADHPPGALGLLIEPRGVEQRVDVEFRNFQALHMLLGHDDGLDEAQADGRGVFQDHAGDLAVHRLGLPPVELGARLIQQLIHARIAGAARQIVLRVVLGRLAVVSLPGEVEGRHARGRVLLQRRLPVGLPASAPPFQVVEERCLVHRHDVHLEADPVELVLDEHGLIHEDRQDLGNNPTHPLIHGVDKESLGWENGFNLLMRVHFNE